jgi:ABC-type uncharacterized transport system involved in gliding motility auxiliary subunit
MKVSQQSRRQVRLQNAIFIVLFVGIIGLLAWITHEYSLEADWTSGNRNTLTEATQELLRGLDEPVVVTAFIGDQEELRQELRRVAERYQRFKDDFTLRFVNPDLDPERARSAGVTRSGQIELRVGERTELLDGLASEQLVLGALQRLARGGERWLVFLEGHGERNPNDMDNQGYGQLADVMARAGFVPQTLNLIRSPVIPDNTAVLVIGAPERDLLPGEAAAVVDFVERGGNLLWLADPGGARGLEPLAERLGIEFLPGTLVDANPELRLLLGIQHPAVIPVVDYRAHPITERLQSQTLFPFAQGIDVLGAVGWRIDPILLSLPQSWAESGTLDGEVVFDEAQGERAGPLNVGVVMSRPRARIEADADAATDEEAAATDSEEAPAQGEQRIAVVGDADFLSNAFLGYGGNLDLATSLFNWLSEDDVLVNVQPRPAPDTRLELGNAAAIGLSAFFLIVLPFALVVSGVVIWVRRRRR